MTNSLPVTKSQIITLRAADAMDRAAAELEAQGLLALAADQRRRADEKRASA